MKDVYLVAVVGALSNLSYPTKTLFRMTVDWPADTVREAPVPVASYRVLRQLSIDEVDQLVTAFQTGTTIRALAVEFGVHRTTIAGHLRARGVDTSPPGLKLEDVPAAMKLYKECWSLARISAKFKTTDMTVRARLLERGVIMRSPWG